MNKEGIILLIRSKERNKAAEVRRKEGWAERIVINWMTKPFGHEAVRAQQVLLSLVMETLERTELCFPQLLNSSCRKPIPPQFDTMIYILLSFSSLLTAALNLLVIISISHFK